MVDSQLNLAIPDSRGPKRCLLWMTARQWRRVTLDTVLVSGQMAGLALMPYLLARTIDDGLGAGDSAASGVLLGWVAALLGVGVLNAWLGVLRHRTMTRIRMDTIYRTVHAVVAHAMRLGIALPRRVTVGEAVTIGFGDAGVIATVPAVIGPAIGAVCAYGVVAGLMWAVSPPLAVVVLLCVPLLALLVGPLLRRLQAVEATYRERQGALTARIGDLVGGLRVLNGLGGKTVFAARYREDSRRLRAEGYRVGAVTSWIGALGVGLPTLFLAVVMWLAARMAAQGDITVGELVAVYGYATVLVVPVSSLIGVGEDYARGLVAAGRLVRFLRPAPGGPVPGDRDPAPPAEPPAGPAVLHDPESGVTLAPGALTALVSARPAETAAVAERLGRCTASAATWGGVRLDAIAPDRVRERILLADNEADLFAGTLADVVAGARDADPRAVTAALAAAAARDVADALPHGLDSWVEPQGRNLSGGQRQRLRLARALRAEPEVLLAVEPTSAVDAHTEAAIADRLRAARAGRTTAVTTSSPLLLDRADTVHFLVDGRVAATGGHRRLLAEHPGYRRLVVREADGTGGGTGRGTGGSAGRGTGGSTHAHEATGPATPETVR
ncbi:ABC transporter transmembrane domain-containing protein [Streptomyces zingiberis]|uniref:ABC transporter ATP-binding protein n=1 Tax=Streptomyces zingiberis TaxID=2053010 RepID=A0ABX1C309_9ACTN|nr:ABC transporter ATP-binding protein [Streptomyces zingiberis]NJQ03065.1 ABC transporter ATP-binding protein [Streptomyces zingiberis]